MKNYTVYIHINKTNNKKYIGITSKKVNKRWGNNGKGYKKGYFHNAIKKYGWDNFEHLILYENLSEKDAKNKEIELIKIYNTFNKKYGYNLTYGGQGNIPNNITREKLSLSQKIIWSNIEYKNKMIKIMKEIRLTKEYKDKMSNISKNNWQNPIIRNKITRKLIINGQTKEFKEKMRLITSGENNPFYGKKHSETSKIKMKDKKLGRSISKECKKKISESLKKEVVKLDLKGNFIAIYKGISHINEGYATNHISGCCRGKRKSASGFKWMYKEDWDKQQEIKIQ